MEQIDTSAFLQNAILLDNNSNLLKRDDDLIDRNTIEVREATADDASDAPAAAATSRSKGNTGTANTGTSGTAGTGGTGTIGTGTSVNTGTGTVGTQAFSPNTFLGDLQLVSNSIMTAARSNGRIGTDFGGQLNNFFGDIMNNFDLQGFYAFYMLNICDGEFFQTGNLQQNGQGGSTTTTGTTNNLPLIFNTFQCVQYSEFMLVYPQVGKVTNCGEQRRLMITHSVDPTASTWEGRL